MKADPKIPEELMRLIGAGMQERMKKEQADKVKNYRILNACAKKGGILFTGSSLMEQFPVCELAMDAGITRPVYNRGIGGTTTDDFLREIDTVLLDLEPSKVFLNIGTNDMTDRIYGEKWMEHLRDNYETILRIAREKLPDAEISTAWPIIPRTGICRIRTNGRRPCSRTARWKISQPATRGSKPWLRSTGTDTST